MATARKWTQDQSRHLSGYKWVGWGSRRLQESAWHLTQCSSGRGRTTANLTRLFSPFNYAARLLFMYLRWTFYPNLSSHFHLITATCLMSLMSVRCEMLVWHFWTVKNSVNSVLSGHLRGSAHQMPCKIWANLLFWSSVWFNRGKVTSACICFCASFPCSTLIFQWVLPAIHKLCDTLWWALGAVRV